MYDEPGDDALVVLRDDGSDRSKARTLGVSVDQVLAWRKSLGIPRGSDPARGLTRSAPTTSTLRRSTLTSRSAPLQRTATPPRRSPIRARGERRKPMDPDLRPLLLRRCCLRCEACGQFLTDGTGVHVHHRVKRSQGGEDVMSNLVALHPDCHVIAPHAVHQRSAWAYERGLLVPRGVEPAGVPLLIGERRRVLLHPTEPRYTRAA